MNQGRYDRKDFVDDLKAQANKQKLSGRERFRHRAKALHGSIVINRIQKSNKANGESSNLMKGRSIRGKSKDEKIAIERILSCKGRER